MSGADIDDERLMRSIRARAETIDPATTAIVFNDMVNHNIRGSAERTRQMEASPLIPRAVSLIAGAREQGIPIYWIQVTKRSDRADSVVNITDDLIRGGLKLADPVLEGSHGAQNIEELPVLADDQVVIKSRMDPFYGTSLDYQLRARGIRTVAFGGVSTQGGVESGIRSARDRGYDVVALSDCCYWVEEELHNWAVERIFPRWGRVMTSQRFLELTAQSVPAAADTIAAGE